MSSASAETKLQLLNDHYKDTYSYIRGFERERNRLLLIVLLVVTLMLTQLFSPDEANEVISSILGQQLGVGSAVEISFLSTAVWFVLLILVVRYFQTVVNIERQYKYMHQLEDQLSPHFEGGVFTRHGKSYLTNRPKFLWWVWWLYQFVIPLALLIAIGAKIYSEWQDFSWPPTALLLANTVIFVSIALTTLLYFRMVFFREKGLNPPTPMKTG